VHLPRVRRDPAENEPRLRRQGRTPAVPTTSTSCQGWKSATKNKKKKKTPICTSEASRSSSTRPSSATENGAVGLNAAWRNMAHFGQARRDASRAAHAFFGPRVHRKGRRITTDPETFHTKQTGCRFGANLFRRMLQRPLRRPRHRAAFTRDRVPNLQFVALSATRWSPRRQIRQLSRRSEPRGPALTAGRPRPLDILVEQRPVRAHGIIAVLLGVVPRIFRSAHWPAMDYYTPLRAPQQSSASSWEMGDRPFHPHRRDYGP